MIVMAEQVGDREEEADLWEQYTAIDEKLRNLRESEEV